MRDADEGDDPLNEPPWHERTSNVVIASIAALLALAIVYFLISTLARQFNQPDQAPSYYVDPGSSSSFSRGASTTTTTESITSTVPPVTTELNPGDASTTPSTTSSTDTSSTPSTTYLPSTHRSTPSSEDGEPSSTRSRPRFNETRTLYPRPG